MPRAPYNTSSLDWQARRLLRRFTEWMEYRFSQTDVDLPELPDWSWPEEIAEVLFWLLVSALALWLGWLLYQALEPPISRWLAKEQKWVTLGGGVRSPIEATHSVQHWLREAQTLAQQGNYKEACKALYRGTLQQLHDNQTLPHDLSRTDGEYLKGLGQRLNDLPRPYQLLIGTHERLMFGSAIASAEMFQRCRRAYEEIQKT